MFESRGTISISPPLLWSEVKTAGFMIADSKGVPAAPPGQWIELVADDELINKPEGTLHRYTFAALREVAVEVPMDQREMMRAQVEAIVNTFSANTFGETDRAIRFRGNELDDLWRIRVNPDRTVVRQTADLSWVTAPLAGRRLLSAVEDDEDPQPTPQGGPPRTPLTPRDKHCGSVPGGRTSKHERHDWGPGNALHCSGHKYTESIAGGNE